MDTHDSYLVAKNLEFRSGVCRILGNVSEDKGPSSMRAIKHLRHIALAINVLKLNNAYWR